MIRRWVLACAAAEAVGMAASAGAARAGQTRGATVAFLLILAGGLVEGTTLGLTQSSVLRERLGRRRPWVVATALVAGLGWAAGSAPAAVSGDDGGVTPPLGLILLGAAAMGLVLGPLLGAAQGLVLRRAARHPWRWVTANACGWAAAMPVIFLGATTAGAGWSWPVLVGYGAVTGLIAGAALGAITGLWLGSLDGLPVRHRTVLAWLAWRGVEARDGWTALTVTGTRSGRPFTFPVMCAPLGHDSLVVLPGRPERKSWWRQIHEHTEVGVLDDGVWARADARLLEDDATEWPLARAAYTERWPRAAIADGPLVVLDLHPAAVAPWQDATHRQ